MWRSAAHPGHHKVISVWKVSGREDILQWWFSQDEMKTGMRVHDVWPYCAWYFVPQQPHFSSSWVWNLQGTWIKSYKNDVHRRTRKKWGKITISFIAKGHHASTNLKIFNLYPDLPLKISKQLFPSLYSPLLQDEAMRLRRSHPCNPNNPSWCDDLFILVWAFLSLVPFRWGQTTQRGASSDSLGTLQNYDGDGKENVKKTIGLI